MRVRVSDPDRLRQLQLLFAFDPDAHVVEVGEDELEVWYIGSRNAWAQVRETEMRLRSWMARNPSVVVTLTP